MKAVMRRQAETCSGEYIPVHPGVMRPSGDMQVISVTIKPAPPNARLPRWTRWKSFGVPFSAQYMSIGDTTTRLSSRNSLSLNEVNMGGIDLSVPLLPANQRSTPDRYSPSRNLRFSWLTRWLRVNRL